MKSYVIVAPRYEPTSGGILALYLLNTHLNAAGHSSRVLTPGHGLKPNDQEIVVYPECFCGNMYGSKNVVRYLLMFAGYFGQDTDFDPQEYMYYYSPDFILNGREPENILSIPIINEKRFPYNPEGRLGSCYLAIKYQDLFGLPVSNIPDDCLRINKNIDLPILFKTKKKLITYDNSIINIEAELAGMEIEYRFNEKFEKPFYFGSYFDYKNVRASYQELKRQYDTVQIHQFIARTQERFK